MSMTLNEVLGALGTNRARWEVRNTAKALSMHSWLNTPAETERLAAAKFALGSWSVYARACDAYRDARVFRLN